MDSKDKKLSGKVVKIGKSRSSGKRADSPDSSVEQPPKHAQSDIQRSDSSKRNRKTTSFTSRDILRQALQDEPAKEFIKESPAQTQSEVSLPKRTSIPGGNSGSVASLLSGAMSRSNVWDTDSLETAHARPMLLPITKKEIKEKGVFEARRRRQIAQGTEPSNKDSVFQQNADDLSDIAARTHLKQKLTFVGGGTLLLFVALLQYMTATSHAVSGKEVVFTRDHPNSQWKNPEMSSLEYYLCRGRTKKAGCSDKVYHPFVDWWESNADYLRGDTLHLAVRNLRQTFYSPQRPPDE